jgi:hypothetical protein
MVEEYLYKIAINTGEQRLRGMKSNWICKFAAATVYLTIDGAVACQIDDRCIIITIHCNEDPPIWGELNPASISEIIFRIANEIAVQVKERDRGSTISIINGAGLGMG